MPHALLLTGMDGIGKRTAALQLAMAVNCTADFLLNTSHPAPENPGKFPVLPCGRCPACLRIAEGIHPDIVWIHPEGGVVKIAQIRNLCDTLSMKAFEGKKRVAILVDAHLMNPSSANALLKMLEEPPEETLLILTAAQAADLLPTIVSRCQHIRFNPVSRQKLCQALIQHHGFSENEAHTVSALACGSFSRALAMKHSDWMVRRNWVINELKRIADAPMHVVLALSEKLSKNRDALPEVFEIMASWFRDLLVVMRDPSKIINRDRMKDIQTASRRHAAAVWLACINAVQTAQTRVDARTNVRLSMDCLLLMIHRQMGAADAGELKSW